MGFNDSRILVVILFALVLVSSGCVDNSTSGTQDESPTDNSESSDISLNSLNVPGEVEMGESYTVEATFENSGGKSGEFETTVMIRDHDSSSFSATENTISGEIGPGEQETYETSLKASDVSSNVIGLAGTNAESSLRIVPKKIEVGDEYSTSNRIGITVKSVELASYYRYEDYMGEERIQEPDSGQYIFVNIKTQNQGDVPKSLPSSYDFQIVANNRQYESTTSYNEPIGKGEIYEGGEVQPGIIREGYMVFEVPEDVNKGDISVVWNEIISLNEKSVYWTAQN